MDKVLILDSNQRSALAATRSLGKKGLIVITADETQKTLAGSSRYSTKNIVYPSPYIETHNFINSLCRSIESLGIDFLLPMTDITTEVVLKHRKELLDVILPMPDYQAYKAVTDKFNLFKTAQKTGIPIPNTIFVTNTDIFFSNIDKIKYPVVLKPSQSRILIDDLYHSTSVKYAYSENELKSIINKCHWFLNKPFLVQEYIQGEGLGIFVICHKGKIMQYFSHKRIREKPPSGGVSVLSESIETDSKLLEITKSILTPLKWDGIAMVEFKVTKEGLPFLMEVNGRFWGSLQLSIDATVDFPYLLYKMFTNNNEIESTNYKTGIQLRWLLGDLDHLIITIKDHKIGYVEKIKSIIIFFMLYQRNQRYEINRLEDFKPFIFELYQYLKESILK